MNLSKRERFLIGLMLFVLLWALAYRGWIGPEYQRLMETRQQVKALAVEKDRLDLYLEHFPELEKKIKDLKENEPEDFFYRDIDDVFMDRRLQEIAGSAGITIMRMSIGEPEPAEEAETEAVESRAVESRAVESKAVESRAAEPEADGAGRFFVTTVTMEVRSPDVSHVMEFADGVYRESHSLVISYMDLETPLEDRTSYEDETSHEKETDRAGGVPGDGGMVGIMEVRFYHEKTK